MNRINVDNDTGSDGLAQRCGSVFKTLQAARNAAVAGDTIVVHPSAVAYVANDLAKDGVNWFFYAGAKVTWDYTAGGSTRAIFDDQGVAMTFRVDGFGEFFTTGTISTLGAYHGSCLAVTHANSNVHFRCASIDTDVDSSASLFGVWVKNCNRVWVECDRIAACRFAPVFEASCVGWENGEMYLKAKEILFADVNGLGWTVYAQEPGGGASVNAYIEADLISNVATGAIYMSAISLNYKMWIRAKEVRGGNYSGVSTAGCVELAGSGKLYVDALKLSSAIGGSPGLGGLVAVKQSGGELWVTAQKVTHETVLTHTNPMFLHLTGGTAWLRVQQYEHVGNVATGEAWRVTGGTAQIMGGAVRCLNGKGLVHSGGTSRLTGVHVDTSPTNAAANRPVETSAAGVILRDCFFVTPALANSLYAAAAQNVKVKNCAANIAKHANVTLLIDAAGGLLVDANVS